MIDSIGISQSLAGLLEVGCSEAFDWDTSALADWPNIAPAENPSLDPTPISTAAVFRQAC